MEAKHLTGEQGNVDNNTFIHNRVQLNIPPAVDFELVNFVLHTSVLSLGLDISPDTCAAATQHTPLSRP